MRSPGRPGIRRGFTAKEDAASAVDDLAAALAPEEAEAVVLFCSSRYDLEALGASIERAFGTTPVVGCTTAGEIAPHGLARDGILAISLPRGDFVVETEAIDDLSSFEPGRGGRVAAGLRSRLEARSGPVSGTDTFAFLLVDGLSRREERLTASLHPGLDGIPLFGGSAGDGDRFHRTCVYHEGAFVSDRAVLSLVRTSHVFQVFRTQHFLASDVCLVVTGSDPTIRRIYEIDGEPAAIAFARHLGIPPTELSEQVLSRHPVAVKLAGDYYLRSILRGHSDHSFELACAIDQGEVLRLARAVDMATDLERALSDIRRRLGPLELVIGCDGLSRRIEAESSDQADRISSLLRQNRVVGFTTYGEQYNAVHLNQTLAGVAIGTRRAA